MVQTGVHLALIYRSGSVCLDFYPVPFAINRTRLSFRAKPDFSSQFLALHSSVAFWDGNFTHEGLPVNSNQRTNRFFFRADHRATDDRLHREIRERSLISGQLRASSSLPPRLCARYNKSFVRAGNVELALTASYFRTRNDKSARSGGLLACSLAARRTCVPLATSPVGKDEFTLGPLLN